MRLDGSTGSRQISATSRRIAGWVIALLTVAFLVAIFTGLIQLFP
jgi:hypothetical protein